MNCVRIASVVIGIAIFGLLGCEHRPQAPIALERVTVVESPHGKRSDEYYWLRDDHPERKSDEVMGYLRAEQAYTEGMLARLAPLQDRLAGEFRARIAEDDTTPSQVVRQLIRRYIEERMGKPWSAGDAAPSKPAPKAGKRA